ncbi:MAG: U32 family peptidase [Desulfotalea sp.]
MTRKIELLAPAKDLLCGMSGINHGADAVYIGGPSFGARKAVGNSLRDIEKLVAYGHRFTSKVYVALNTLLNDDELEEAVKLCHDYYEMGVDALIVQDMGLLECDLPPIALHASTQCNNRSPEKVSFLEQVGFEQVVLARELSFSQIKEIRSKTNTILEFFIHGALCVSYSGHCYISEVMAGRSGNRGECAQFCRHRYKLTDSNSKIIADEYVLSLKDFNLSNQLEGLIDAGIDSFKIEGRLKGEQYVKNVTSYYRQELDRILSGNANLKSSSSGCFTPSFSPNLSKSFNRGSSDYFLNSNTKGKKIRPGSTKTPKAMGELIGKVLKINKKWITIENGNILNNGDGCCSLSKGESLVGFLVNKVESNNITPAKTTKLQIGDIVYRNTDLQFNKIVKASIGERRIGLNLRLNYLDGKLELLIKDEDGVNSIFQMEIEYQEAQKEGIANVTAKRQLLKCGDTIFSIGSVEINLPKMLFVSAADFNNLRRLALLSHEKKRLDSYKISQRNELELDSHYAKWPAENIIYTDNIRNDKAKEFYLKRGASLGGSMSASSKPPFLMHCKYCVRAEYRMCDGKGNAEDLFIEDKTGKYRLAFDCENCEMKVLKD